MGERATIDKDYLYGAADAIRRKNGTSNTYTPDQFEAAIDAIPTGGITPTGTINITSNGTVDVTQYATANVYVSGGGSGVVLSGTSAPTAAVGNDEDLYVQYEAFSPSLANHTYAVTALFRKENGNWTPYTDPTYTHGALHIWTKSTGGMDAAMYVQYGYYDISTSTFVATGEIESLLYTNAGTAVEFYGVASIQYPGGNWYAKALTGVSDGTDTYAAGDTIKTWAYSANADFHVWIP